MGARVDCGAPKNTFLAWVDSQIALAIGAAKGAKTPPGGVNTSVQFNNNGVFGGDANFQYATATRSLTMGSGATCSGTDSAAMGLGATVSANNCFAFGDGALASANNAIAMGNGCLAEGTSGAIALGITNTSDSSSAQCLGALCTSDGVAGSAIGEESVIEVGAANGVAIGFDNIANNQFACAIGSAVIVSGEWAFGRGTGSGAGRAGEDTFGAFSQTKYTNIDVSALLAAATGNLNDAAGNPIVLQENTDFLLELFIQASEGGTAPAEPPLSAQEVWLISIWTGAQNLQTDAASPTKLYKSSWNGSVVGTGGLTDNGWALTVTPKDSTFGTPWELQIVGNPGAATVRFDVHLRWHERFFGA
jgi:trimeric autotransporter adhesin